MDINETKFLLSEFKLKCWEWPSLCSTLCVMAWQNELIFLYLRHLKFGNSFRKIFLSIYQARRCFAWIILLNTNWEDHQESYVTVLKASNPWGMQESDEKVVIPECLFGFTWPVDNGCKETIEKLVQTHLWFLNKSINTIYLFSGTKWNKAF